MPQANAVDFLNADRLLEKLQRTDDLHKARSLIADALATARKAERRRCEVERDDRAA